MARSNRPFWIGLAVSILLHALVLAIPERKRILDQGPLTAALTPGPMTVRIVPAPSSEAAEAEPAASPQPAPEPPAVPPKRPPAAPPRTSARAPPRPVDPTAPPAPASPQAPPSTQPPADMSALVEARRALRLRQEAEARGPREAPPADPAAESLDRNLKSLAQGAGGTGGVFEILRKGQRTAEFAFNGWRPGTTRGWREVIEVDAGLGGDVDLAIVRRMIALIRSHYTGDFRWESHRLGRIVILSARTEDNEGLEDFMMREFFGQPVLRAVR